MLAKPFPRSRCYAPALLASVVVFGACGGGASRYQGMEPDALFQLAVSEVESGDHGNAIQALDRLLVAHGDWSRVAEARLMLADVYFDRGDFLTARSEYQRFMDRYAGHPRSPDASLGICRSLASLRPVPQRDQGYTEEAITSCRNVVIDYAGLPQSAEAARVSNELRHTLAEKEFLNAEFYFRRKIFDAAIKYYEFVIRLYPESEFVPRSLLGVYYSNMEIGYEDLAEEARRQLLEDFPDSDAAGLIRTDGPAG